MNETNVAKPDLAFEENTGLTQSFLDLCSDAIFVTNENLQIVLANENAVDLSEYHHDELIGAPLTSLLSSQNKLLRKNSHPLDVTISERPLHNRYQSHVIHPVVGRLDSTAKITGLDPRLAQFAVEHAMEAAFWVKRDGRLIYVNEAACHALSYARKDLLRLNIRDIDPSFREAKSWRKFWKRISKEKRIHFESVHEKKDGTGFPVEIAFHYVDCDGKEYVCVFARDMEAALRESEEKYRTLFEESRDMVYINTAEGEMLDVNQAASDVLGYSKDTLLQMNVKELYVDLKLRQKFQKEIEREGAVKDFQVNLFAKDGSIKTCLITSTARLDKDGNLLGYHGIIRDVTQEKLLQEELQRAYRLESAGKLAGQIAHDFNNLLSPLAAYPALIREELPDDHSAHSLLDEMEFTANKIAEINQQLLTLGRRGHYNIEPIDLNELVHQVVVTQHLSESIEVREELASDLFMIKGGEAQLTRALINLVNNAAEAMNGKGSLFLKTQNVYLDVPLIGYKTINRGEYVCLSVSDTGNGIAPEIIDRIFDPFFTTKTMDRQRGSGLGLSVVHSIVEDNNGYITVDSTERGTAFSLYFPVAREYETHSKEDHTEIKQGYEHVLIVDDDPMQRKVVSQLLQRFGYQVDTVSSGEDAVEHVRRHQPDLLLLDMVMDGIDGTETYRQILEFKPEQKAILLSGYAMV